jgi:2-keto-4-pentenoate hydratase/2-oxohepta-3-ene-1,7-dioic acid hydratase in catechol pathway
VGNFKLLNYADAQGKPRPAIATDSGALIDLRDKLADKPWSDSTLSVLGAWAEALPVLHALAQEGAAGGKQLKDVRVLAPLLYPPAIYCAGANYNDHAKEMTTNREAVDKTQTRPYFFLKSGPHCIVGTGDAIKLPKISKKVDWEAEFAVVIGKRGRNIPLADTMSYVAGYTIMNDVSARDLMARDDWPRFKIDWFGHKNFETAAPLGPWIVPADQIGDPAKCSLRLWVNDDKMQDTMVSELTFNIPEMIEYLSQRMTLLPGDVIATGTPAGVGRARGIFLKPGDRVRVEVSGIGSLENPVEQGE